MVKTAPYSSNTYVPHFEAGKSLEVDFSRNVNDFAINRYCQLIPGVKPVGLYIEMSIDSAGRVSADGAEYMWPDGGVAPGGLDGLEDFEWKEYRCIRYANAFVLGDIAVDNADFDVVSKHAARAAQREMTLRTIEVCTQATTSGNYDSSHVLAVGSISGNSGTWAQSTTQRSDIQRSLNVGREQIIESTLGAVDIDDLMLVINVDAARQLRESQEVIDFIKGSPEAMAQINGELKTASNATQFGLPSKLFGLNVQVEKTQRVTSKKGATRAVTPALATATPFICARPGGLIGVDSAPSFSTHTLFMNEDMETEIRRDADNRRTVGRVVSNRKAVVTAPTTGILFTGAF